MFSFFQLKQEFGKIRQKEKANRVEWWVVLVAVVGALILLDIFCVILYRVSVFLWTENLLQGGHKPETDIFH